MSAEMREPDDPGAERVPARPRSLAAAEHDTGLSRATLLDWERRYGFPCPTRDAVGQRQYPADQIQRLRSIRWALEAGLSPGEVVPIGRDQRAPLPGRASAGRACPAADEGHVIRSRAIARLRANDVDGLQRLLTQTPGASGAWGASCRS
jgi:DNA-binding transcriptional MerR regulator